MEEVYSLKSLVSDIYGTSEKMGTTYEANYKELQRIDKIIRRNSDYSQVKGILKENKDKYVALMKDIVFNNDVKSSIEKLNKGKKITYEEIQTIINIYLKHDPKLKNRVDTYNDMHRKLEIAQGKAIGILKGIIEYFTVEELLIVEESIFNDTLSKIVLLTDEYKNQVDSICKDAIEKCEYYNKIDNQIYTHKLINTLIPSIESRRFISQYNKEIKNKEI